MHKRPGPIKLVTLQKKRKGEKMKRKGKKGLLSIFRKKRQDKMRLKQGRRRRGSRKYSAA